MAYVKETALWEAGWLLLVYRTIWNMGHDSPVWEVVGPIQRAFAVSAGLLLANAKFGGRCTVRLLVPSCAPIAMELEVKSLLLSP